ncbi:MAG: GAF domain-containing protein [Hymenobacter sp.]|nr:MAG: GAF domain-containing protein [Hymenobacter sp.]
MITTPPLLLPTHEAERLHSLQHYDIVHSLQEEVFDELVVLTASLFRLPVAYIALVDADQVHHKAVFGFPRASPRPRAEQMCSLVVKRSQVVVYQDLSLALLTPLNTLAVQKCLAQHIRFYAGAPLRTPEHHIIGTLCLAGPQPREFSLAEQQLLETIAGVVSQTIVLRSLCRSSGVLGELRWQDLRTQARDEVYALGALVRYLATRYGTPTPVPEEILNPVKRRLHDLSTILQEYDYETCAGSEEVGGD